MPPRSASRFVRLRQQAFAKLSALAFIALILLPFTQPFPTYQLDPAHGQPFDALPKEYKNKVDADGDLIVPTISSVDIPGVNQIATPDVLPLNVIVDLPPLRLVLRL